VCLAIIIIIINIFNVALIMLIILRTTGVQKVVMNGDSNTRVSARRSRTAHCYAELAVSSVLVVETIPPTHGGMAKLSGPERP